MVQSEVVATRAKLKDYQYSFIKGTLDTYIVTKVDKTVITELLKEFNVKPVDDSDDEAEGSSA